MLRIDTPASEYLERTAGIVPASSDYTVIFFYRPNVTPTSTNYLTQYYCGDDPAIDYLEYVGIFTDDTDSDKLKLYVSDGVTTEISIGSAFDLQQFRCVAYVRSGNDHKFYVNGSLIDTLTLDISACNFTNFLLGSDKFGAASNHDFFQCREWSRALTIDEIQEEFRSAIPVDDTDLETDYPLLSDGNDDSGNGYDLTENGTVEWLGQPPNNLTAFSSIVVEIPSTGNYNANRSDNFETFPVWFEFDNPVDNKMVSVIAYNNVGNYKPRIQPYSDSTTRILNISALNRPVQFPVSSSGSKYILINKDSNELTADFSLELTPFTPITIPRGSIAVNDDTAGFPLAILSVFTDYTALDFILGFPAGEAGDILTNGIILVEDKSDGTLKARNADYSNLNTLAYSEEPRIRTCRGQNVFFVGSNANPPVIQTVNASGNFTSDTWTLTGGGSGLRALAAKNDGSLLYYANLVDGVALKVWDLVNNVLVGELVAGVSGYYIPDILVLEDDTLIVSYYNNTTKDFFVKHYDEDGNTLHTYEFGIGANSNTFPRMAYSLDNTISFWVFFHPETGISNFIEIEVATGNALTTRSQVEYETGSYQKEQTGSPLSKWGHSNSCPFWIVQDGDTPSFGIFLLSADGTIQPPTPFYKTYFHGE